jgi:UPF0176 protein
MRSIKIASVYCFFDFQDFRQKKNPLLEVARQLQLRGSLLLASEGINGTLSGKSADLDAFVDCLKTELGIEALNIRVSFADRHPFPRLKFKEKSEIVTMGIPGVDPRERVGTYLNAAEWNRLIASEDVVVIDTRNDYEVQLGSFKGAINPETHSFREFPEYVRTHLPEAKDRPLALFCTGGIRCEKATAWLLQEGYQHVYHLKGGILGYLETVEKDESLWDGDCFVFDHRTAVSETLEPSAIELCQLCQRSIVAGKSFNKTL